MKFVIGSRGSKLALTQTHWVSDRLQTLEPDLDIEVAEIRTTGDTAKGSLRSFGGAGVFTKELERALLDERVDLAVHSLKDLPTDVHPDLALVAAPEREDVRDTLIGPNLTALDDLSQGALIGTGSLRRQAQLKALRPDLSFADIRGNLDTRIEKAMRGECDAVVLAAAGLHRLGWHGRISAYLTTDEILPAPGQAALGLLMRADHPLRDRVAFLDDPATAAAVPLATRNTPLAAITAQSSPATISAGSSSHPPAPRRNKPCPGSTPEKTSSAVEPCANSTL